MPQMAPLSWVMLFSSFSIILILFSILNYYITQHLPVNNLAPTSQTLKGFNWKW